MNQKTAKRLKRFATLVNPKNVEKIYNRNKDRFKSLNVGQKTLFNLAVKKTLTDAGIRF